MDEKIQWDSLAPKRNISVAAMTRNNDHIGPKSEPWAKWNTVGRMKELYKTLLWMIKNQNKTELMRQVWDTKDTHAFLKSSIRFGYTKIFLDVTPAQNLMLRLDFTFWQEQGQGCCSWCGFWLTPPKGLVVSSDTLKFINWPIIQAKTLCIKSPLSTSCAMVGL